MKAPTRRIVVAGASALAISPASLAAPQPALVLAQAWSIKKLPDSWATIGALEPERQLVHASLLVNLVQETTEETDSRVVRTGLRLKISHVAFETAAFMRSVDEMVELGAPLPADFASRHAAWSQTREPICTAEIPTFVATYVAAMRQSSPT